MDRLGTKDTVYDKVDFSIEQIFDYSNHLPISARFAGDILRQAVKAKDWGNAVLGEQF